MGTQNWPMARVTRTFPGNDGLVRVVELQANGKIVCRPVVKLALLFPKSEVPHVSPREEVCARLVRAAVDDEGRNSLPLTSSPGYLEVWETEKDRYLSQTLLVAARLCLMLCSIPGHRLRLSTNQ